MNTALWDFINEAGWLWWAPCILIATKNLYILANLRAPATNIGRIARVFAWLGHLPWPFVGIVAILADILDVPASLNALGPVSVPLLLIANNALYMQLWLACRTEQRNPSANARHTAHRILRAMVQPADEDRR